MASIYLRARMELLFAGGPDALDVELVLEAGSLTGLYGPSGSGKTTLLRILAGLTPPAFGEIRVGEQIWFDSAQRINWPPQQRNVGMVFQDAALFPNMTVRQNVQFAAGNQRDPFVDELLELAGLTTLAERKPATLSGGQRQRVALVRALARRPQVLLLDEPFSALDADTREPLLDELLRLHQRFGTTTVLVSHQHEEVQRIADQWIELKQGKLVRHGQKKPPIRTGLAYTIEGKIIAVGKDPSQVSIQLLTTGIVMNTHSDGFEWQIGDLVTLNVEPATVTRQDQ
ncbi:ATP-binding cassette domain-containing protein [Larkinella sp. VNQ87]|uniref:ATP-binding cassette domain-containing protein n=1 Tax=Larkinella sp. VNQ87 TaxID=3400921 RepID=UPI003BFD7404